MLPCPRPPLPFLKIKSSRMTGIQIGPQPWRLLNPMTVKYIFMFISLYVCIYLLLRLLKDEMSDSFMFFTMLGGVLDQ